MSESVHNRFENVPLEVLQPSGGRQRSNTRQTNDETDHYTFAQEMSAASRRQPASSTQPRTSTDVQNRQSTAIDPRLSMDPSRFSGLPFVLPDHGLHQRDSFVEPPTDHRDSQNLRPSMENISGEYAASSHPLKNSVPDVNEPTTFSDENSTRNILKNSSELTINRNQRVAYVAINWNKIDSNNNRGGLQVDTNGGTLHSTGNEATTTVPSNRGEFDVKRNSGHVDVGTNASHYSSEDGSRGSSENITKNAGDIAVRDGRGYISVDRNDRKITLGRRQQEPVAETRDLEAQFHVPHQPGRSHQPHVSGRSSIVSASENSHGHGARHVEHVSPRLSIATQASQVLQASRPAQFGTAADDGAAVAGLLKGGKLHIRDQNGFVEHTVIDKNGNPKTTLYEPAPGRSLTLDHNGKVEQESAFRRIFEEVGNQGVRVANIIGTFTNPLAAIASGLAIYGAFKSGPVAGGGATTTPSTLTSTSTSIMPGHTHMLNAATQVSLPPDIPVLSPSITPDHVPAGSSAVTSDQPPVIMVTSSQ